MVTIIAICYSPAGEFGYDGKMEPAALPVPGEYRFM
jgi:hypothetical protein